MDRLYINDNRFLFCFWHGKYVPILPLLEGRKARVVTNRSARGAVIAEICKNFGYQSTRIPDQPGHGSLRFLGEALSETRAGAIAVDGPLGPRHRVKDGVIQIASRFGFELLPVSLDSCRKIVLHRWDRMEIPLPFTRVCLNFGVPVKVPPGIREGQVRTWADKLGKSIERLDRKAENRVHINGIKKRKMDFNG